MKKVLFALVLFMLCGRINILACDTLVVDLSKQEIYPGIIHIPISAFSLQAINWADFDLQFNNNYIEFHSIESLKPTLNWSNSISDSNFIHFTSYTNLPIENYLPFIKVRFSTEKEKIIPSDIFGLTAKINRVAYSTKIITSICSGGSVELSANGTADDTYLWSTGETTKSITVNTPGKYYATIKYSNGTTQQSTIFQVIVEPVPEATIILSGPGTFCKGDSVILKGNYNNSYSYLWSTGAITSSITIADSSGEYSVEVTDAKGCKAVSPPVSVTINPIPGKQLVTTGANMFCEGGSIAISAEEGPGYSYIWSNGKTTRTIKSDTTGNYYAELTNSFGCSVISDTVHTTVFQNPDDSLIIIGTTSFCAGDSVILAACDKGEFTYLWSNGADTRSVTLKESGNYSVTIQNAIGCTATSSPIEVYVNFLPADLDRSGIVGISDVIMLQNVFGLLCSCIEDLDKNGAVGVYDLTILMNDFGKSCQ